MTKPAIKVEGLWKEYVIGAPHRSHGTFYDMLSHTLAAPLRALRRQTDEQRDAQSFWALSDVNFEVQPGEVVGIIGRNGAGKSTLLKILSRITAPTRGRVEVQGRLASLLEVGTGFHPELSGRENVFLNGAILGMKRAEVARKFDEIVAFAEVDKFIDTPVKRYSSGMYVRLAFAVAAHLEPDVLIVDEVLAVGDAEFQRKCLSKLDDVSEHGRSVVLVSHSLDQLGKICGNATWLDAGTVVESGTFDRVANLYQSRGWQHTLKWIPPANSERLRDFEYREILIDAGVGSSPESVPASKPIRVRFVFEVLSEAIRTRIALQILDAKGAVVLSSANTDASTGEHQRWKRGLHVLVCTIPANLLSPGLYSVNVSRPSGDADEILEGVCTFTVDTADSLRARDGRAGAICPLLEWVEHQ